MLSFRNSIALKSFDRSHDFSVLSSEQISDNCFIESSVVPKQTQSTVYHNNSSNCTTSKLVATSARGEENGRGVSPAARAPLSDYKPFKTVFSVGNLVEQSFKAFLLPFVAATHDLNKYMDELSVRNQRIDDIRFEHRQVSTLAAIFMLITLSS